MKQDEIDKIVGKVLKEINDTAAQKSPAETPQMAEQENIVEKTVVENFPILRPIRGKSYVLITEDILKKFVPKGGIILVEGKYIITPSAADFIRKKGVKIEVAENASSNNRTSNTNGAIAIGSDHRGFSMKEFLKAELTKLGYRIIDVGTNDSGSCDYPDFAGAAADKVSAGEAKLGIVIDSAGIGSAIAANKISGIRAAVCWDETTAKQAKLHNNANVMCIGADNIAPAKALTMAKNFIETEYIPNERFDRRIQKITQIEQETKAK